MAGGKGLWQRLPTLSKFGLAFSIANICFLLVSLGLTSWSVSGYRFFIDFFEQRSSSGTPFPTSYFTDSDITSATTGINSDDDFSTGNSSGSSSSSRSYSTFTSTYTSTRTSYTTDPASYTSTSLRTFSLLGTPYRTFTYYYGGEQSAYTTVTSTGERLVRTQLRKRDLPYETSVAAAEPSPSVRPSTAWPVPAASPTSAPPVIKPVSEAPRLPLLPDDPQVRLALPRTMRFHRRQSSSILSTIDDFLRAARVLLALNAVILAAVVVQLLLCIAYIAVLCKGHKSHRTDHKLLRGSTRTIYMSTIVTSLLIFVLAIVVVAYGSKTLGQTSSFVALHIVFWLVCALLGFILAINAYKLSRHSFHHLSASRDSTIEPLETMEEQQENGPFIFAFNRDQQQADREAHDPPQGQSSTQTQTQPGSAAAERPAQAGDEAAAAATPSQDHQSSSAADSQQQSSSASQPSPARQYSIQDYSPHTHTHEHYHGGSLADGRQSKDVPAPPPYSDSETRCSHCAGAA